MTTEFYLFENISFVHKEGNFILKKGPSVITFMICLLAIPVAIFAMKSLIIVFFFSPIIIYVLISSKHVTIFHKTGEIVFQNRWLFIGGKKTKIRTSIPAIVNIDEVQAAGSNGIRTYYALCLVNDKEHDHPLLLYESLSTSKYLRLNLSRLSKGILVLDNQASDSD